MPTEQNKDNCRNCGTLLAGAYCHVCGQSATTVRRPTTEILKEARSHILHWDARFLQTLKLLLFRPGRLSLDWIEEKRARHVPPFRLYIVASFILFLLIGFVTEEVRSQAETIQVSGETFDVLRRELDEARENGQWLISVFLQGTIQGLEDPVSYLQAIIANLPKAAFLLLPLFALLHKLVDLRQKRFYIDYLVFSLNFHAFAFLVIAFGILLGLVSEKLDAVGGVLNLVIPIYGVIGFKTFGGQGWIKSFIKAIIAFGAYAVILSFLVAFYFATVLVIQGG